MTVGSLFSGIGGLDLGLEWAGFETKWFCEIEKFPQAVLRKHWPNTPIIEDVRNVTTGNVQRVDVIAGGFPCQDISWAGKGRGIDYDLSEQEGTRSGLWWEMWRVIRDLRPRYVIAENVPALTHRGLDIVLGSLAEIGYDAEWQTISAAGVGAPHIRERVFIVAYPNNKHGRWQECEGFRGGVQGQRRKSPEIRSSKKGDVAYRNNPGLEGRWQQRRQRGCVGTGGLEAAQPDWFAGSIGQPYPVSFKMGNTTQFNVESDRKGACQQKKNSGERADEHRGAGGAQDADVVNPERIRRGRGWIEQQEGVKEARGASESVQWMETEYDFRGVAYGVSDRVGALKGYGNAVVPQVGYLVGRAVREHAEENGWWTP